MNYGNYSMDELANLIINEPDHRVFIDACKAFVERWVNEDHITQDVYDDGVEEAQDEQAIETRDICREEMAQAIDGLAYESASGRHLNSEAYESLMSTARTLG